MNEHQRLEQTIAVQERLRDPINDEVIDAAIETVEI